MKTIKDILTDAVINGNNSFDIDNDVKITEDVSMAMGEYGAMLILQNEEKWKKKMKDLKETLDDMDSIAMQLEDVLHGNEGKNITSLRHGIIQIKNILR